MPFLDLSHTITEGMVTYPGLPGPTITDHLSYDDSRSHYAEGTEFHIAQIDMIANTGTYLDTPAHRWRGRSDLSAIALERVAGLQGVDPARRPGPRTQAHRRTRPHRRGGALRHRVEPALGHR